MTQIRELKRKKALLAIIFASGVLNTQLPVFSESETQSTDSIIEQLANSTTISPEIRAYSLLSLARSYLKGGDRTKTEAAFANIISAPTHFKPSSRWHNELGSWANQASFEARAASSAKPKTELHSGIQEISAENLVLATEALHQVVTHLDNVSGTFAKLNMYFIASRLYKRLGNFDEMKKCDKVLETAFYAAETGSSVECEQIYAVSSILNSMAYGLIPIHIADHQSQQIATINLFTENEFKESEKLKLRAAAIVDRLLPGDHVRRKVHRDLALWYMKLGKVEKAESEKQALFKLVDSKDEKILYPQHGRCGGLIWWVTVSVFSGSCGMG